MGVALLLALFVTLSPNFRGVPLTFRVASWTLLRRWLKKLMITTEVK
jgi:hypothetical protein